MSIINIAGYKFIELTDLTNLKGQLLQKCQELHLFGTILLSKEGININLAGLSSPVEAFKLFLGMDERFAGMVFNETVSDFVPFKRLKVKIKKEIITFRVPSIHPEVKKAPSITPQDFKKWLDEGRDITVLDTRNNYEIDFGTFEGAEKLNIDHFCDFSTATQNLDSQKTIVMFCTGGIRCEKAALFLLDNGFENVFQLQGGILNYFNTVGQVHYAGSCFVFDERTTISASSAD